MIMLQGGNYYDHEKKLLTYTLVAGGGGRRHPVATAPWTVSSGINWMARQDGEEEGHCMKRRELSWSAHQVTEPEFHVSIHNILGEEW